MNKSIILSAIIIFIIYYITVFLTSFTLLTRSVIYSKPDSFENFINVKKLRNNYYSDIYKFSSTFINSMDKNIKIKSESIELSAELTPAFLEKLFSKIANNVSKDFSNPEIMLYFYFNSKELSDYLNKSFINLGDYNFKKFLLEKQPEDPGPASTSSQPSTSSSSQEPENNKIEEKEESFISKLIKRYKSTDYFFFTSPIHFKIDVKHQDISFILILKFNGYIWKLENIIIPFKSLIDTNNINLINLNDKN